MQNSGKFLKAISAVCIAAGVVFGKTDITDKFIDPNFKAAVYEKIGKTAPTPIYDSDVDTIVLLQATRENIVSLAGIEYFTTLEMLSCGYNQLTTLDVSKNTNLTSLECGHNQLTTLDVSKNTNLTSLECYENQLTTLDVSKNTALTMLQCHENQLTTLDVSKNTVLTILACGGNRLTTLNLSRNTKLSYLDVSNNPIKSENDIIGLSVLNLGDNFVFVNNNSSPIHNAAAKKSVSAVSFAGIRNGEINLNLKAGNYTAELYNLQGRLLSIVNISAINGVNATGIKTNNLSKGMFILNVKQAGVSVLKHKIKI